MNYGFLLNKLLFQSLFFIWVVFVVDASSLSAKSKSVRIKSFFVAHTGDLVEVITINPTIKLDMRYATTNNFTGKILYPSAHCYLRLSVAEKLNKVQKELKTKGLGLKIFDGYRPLSVQKKLWDTCPDKRYVADPKKGSKHNRGSAVDLTLIDLKTGKELEMPSAFDDFSDKAHREYETMHSETAKNNCKLLEGVMVKHGFIPCHFEWWHFDDASWKSYGLLDVAFDELGK